MFIYLAAPLFNANERHFNLAVTSVIETRLSVFLPQRDGSLLVDMVRAGVAVEVAQRRVFEQDREAMRNALALVAILDGAHIDEGVAFEIGFMKALGRVCVGLQTDVRRALPTGNNPMIGGALDAVYTDISQLAEWVERFADARRVDRAASA
jgi:nucleoside 2-deoxyribosyltransferase